MYILIRTDKKYSAGKIGVHIAHNALSCVIDNMEQVELGYHYISDLINDWYRRGQTKIILSVKNLKQLQICYDLAKKYLFPCAMVHDLGFYEVSEGEIIVCAILCNEIEKKLLKLNKLSLYKGENIKK